MQDHPFSAERLIATLERLPIPRKYWVGFSGGADSTALLQAMHDCRSRLAAPLQAVHFHHGLHADADRWQEHCRTFCEARGISFLGETLDIDRSGKHSPEEASRNSRYRAVARILGADEMYLTAHHAEDLAETLFLNLMRGSGLEGLAGIPPLRSLQRGWVARPLLATQRRELQAFLEARGIAWLTDPSNADTAFDRNYLRRELFPLLERRWPGLIGRLTRTARNARVAADAMAGFIERRSGDMLRDRLKMPLRELLELDPEMQSLILRQWLRRHEVPALPEQRLKEFLGQLAAAAPESQAEVQWERWMIKHYHPHLWLHRREPYPPCPEAEWRDGMVLELGPDAGCLRLAGEAVAVPPGWRVRARRPGDRIRERQDRSRRKLKQLFQSAEVPPWLRPGVPVLEWDGEPVALGDWVIGQRLRAWLEEHDLEYRWEPADPVLARVRADLQAEDRNHGKQND